MRGERRILLAQVGLPTGGALEFLHIGVAPDQFLELSSTVVATVFVDRHGYSPACFRIATAILSMIGRITEAGSKEWFAMIENASRRPEG